jgi:hypothetical protein
MEPGAISGVVVCRKAVGEDVGRGRCALGGLAGPARLGGPSRGSQSLGAGRALWRASWQRA